MSSDTIHVWRGTPEAIDTAQRAAAAWFRINRSPVTLTVERGGVVLAAQTVRVEFSTTAPQEPSGATGWGAQQQVVIFGVRGHAAVADTDLKRDDRFSLDGLYYRVVAVITPPGEVQAHAEAVS